MTVRVFTECIRHAAVKDASEPREHVVVCLHVELYSPHRQPQKTEKELVSRSSPYCGGMWRTYCCLILVFFPIVDTCLSCQDIARQRCAMVLRWRFLATFLRPVFSASRVQQVSDLHLKFALWPHHVWKYGRHPICGG